MFLCFVTQWAAAGTLCLRVGEEQPGPPGVPVAFPPGLGKEGEAGSGTRAERVQGKSGGDMRECARSSRLAPA